MNHRNTVSQRNLDNLILCELHYQSGNLTEVGIHMPQQGCIDRDVQ
jgi:hypothetical protein